jgi:hypothetical protein
MTAQNNALRDALIRHPRAGGGIIATVGSALIYFFIFTPIQRATQGDHKVIDFSLVFTIFGIMFLIYGVVLFFGGRRAYLVLNPEPEHSKRPAMVISLAIAGISACTYYLTILYMESIGYTFHFGAIN